jgi:hypothetical protein
VRKIPSIKGHSVIVERMQPRGDSHAAKYWRV